MSKIKILINFDHEHEPFYDQFDENLFQIDKREITKLIMKMKTKLKQEEYF